ncbi:MAG TPA: hypothetical protein VMZ31_03500 [Phycisphaerae bacterium]|nr:hypothetical protein [Phycisphaerae bacterium]
MIQVLQALTVMVAAFVGAGTGDKPLTRQEWLSNLQELIRDAQQLGPWQQNRDLILEANRNLWRQEGWTTESDRFAQQAIEKLTNFPPGQIDERFDAFCDVMAERYSLDAQQRQTLYAIATRDGWASFLRHARPLLPIVREVIATRAAGEPFTAEQVARWCKIVEPMARDMRRQLDKSSAEFARSLRPEQRGRFDRDLVATRRRVDQQMTMMRQWQKGTWRPQDWGLQNDPIHAAAIQDVAQAKAATTRNVPAPAQGDADDWTVYVTNFIVRYGLDDDQQVTAQSILEEVRDRAQGRTDHEATAELFEELKRRLDAIPTQAQRRGADDKPRS